MAKNNLALEKKEKHRVQEYRRLGLLFLFDHEVDKVDQQFVCTLLCCCVLIWWFIVESVGE